MDRFLIIAILMQLLVDFLLILASGRMTEVPIYPIRAVLGALAGGIYAAACTVPRLWFLCSYFWHGVCLVMVCLVSFGMERWVLRAGTLYCLLRTSIDGIASANSNLETLVWTAVLCGVCLYGFRGRKPGRRFATVELSLGENTARLQGLYDTGNSLRDPVTGRPVLVVGADVADRLTGLTPQQLAKPVETMGAIPGLRLIPYKTVGQSGGLLLAMQLKNTKIGKWKGSALVAFAPQVLDEKGTYQALIGGAA